MSSSLSLKAWEPWSTSSKQYLMKMVDGDSDGGVGYQVMWTDMVTLWSESLSEDDIKKRTQLLNPGVEVPTRTVVSHLLKETKPQYCAITENERSEMTVELNSEISGITFLWTFYCEQQPQEELLQSFIRPLMTMSAELQRQQRLLIAIIKKKDGEIDDHKMQRTRKHLETKPFDEKAFYESAFQSKAFDATVSASYDLAFNASNRELYEKIMHKRMELDREDETADEDASSLSTSDISGNVTPTVASPVRPKSSPQKPVDTSLTKEEELSRREALVKRLADEEQRKGEKAKKKKKKALF